MGGGLSYAEPLLGGCSRGRGKLDQDRDSSSQVLIQRNIQLGVIISILITISLLTFSLRGLTQILRNTCGTHPFLVSSQEIRHLPVQCVISHLI